jgi:hypothetical protein
VVDGSSGRADSADNVAPNVADIRRRMLLKGAASAAPVILTLRASPALASTANCEVVEMTPSFDPDVINIGGEEGAWSFYPDDRTPWLGPNSDGVACVEVNANRCPVAVTGYFDTNSKDENYRCTSGIVIAASSGGSFTH